MSKRRAFTIVESVITVFLVMLTMLLMFNVTIQSTRMATKVSTDTSNLADARAGMEKVVEDIKQADMVLTSYPTGAPTLYSRKRDCLILRIPKIDTNANRIAGNFDIVIYRVIQSEAVGAEADTAATYDLERWTARVTGGTESAPVFEGRAASNVIYFGLDYGTLESFRGDEYKKAWGLRAVPLASTKSFTKGVNIAGREWTSLGMATFNGATVEFTRPPRWGVPIDITYPVDPSLLSNPDGGNAANIVNVTIRYRNDTRSAAHAEKKRPVEFETRAQLRNF